MERDAPRPPQPSIAPQLLLIMENGCGTGPDVLLGEKRDLTTTPSLERLMVSLKRRERTDLKSLGPSPN